jgi:drug/metabolite transporter (DMT)-like permease
VSPFNYLQLIGAALLGFVVFGQLPDVFVWCGAAIIAGSGIAMLYVERRGRTAAKTAPRLSPGE